MNLTKDIQPVSAFKRETARLLRQVQDTREPLVLTVNGKAAVVVQDVESYQELLDLKERMETLAGIRRGLESMKQGKGIPLEQFDAEFRQKHNIPATEK